MNGGHTKHPGVFSKIHSNSWFMMSSNRGNRVYNIGFTGFCVLGHRYLSVLKITDMYLGGKVAGMVSAEQTISNSILLMSIPLLLLFEL